MKAVIQRVSHASVTIEGSVKSSIEKGYLILLGICNEDSQEDIDWLVHKIVNLRIFDNENGKCIDDLATVDISDFVR